VVKPRTEWLAMKEADRWNAMNRLLERYGELAIVIAFRRAYEAGCEDNPEGAQSWMWIAYAISEYCLSKLRPDRPPH
jgi:hypothetical protein